MKFDFSRLQSFVDDDLVTDINYNGVDIWVDDLKHGRMCYTDFVSELVMENLCYRLSNYSNLPFNTLHPIMEFEIEELRISCVHACLVGRLCVSIRKTPSQRRFKTEDMLANGGLSQDLLEFLEQAVRARCNFMVSGLPGSGKTEMVKYLTQFIAKSERVITIEDTLELRYQALYPHRDAVSFKVNSSFDYDQAIRASLRLRPDWLLLSEVRGPEVAALLQAISTGASALSTIHAGQADQVPQRILHMFASFEIGNSLVRERILSCIDIGLHMTCRMTDEGMVRCIDHAVCYSNESCVEIYRGGVFHAELLSERLTKKIAR